MNNFDSEKYSYQLIHDKGLLEDLIILERMKREDEERERENQFYNYTTDMLLDRYNDYMALYKTFGDQKYKDEAENVMDELRAR